MKQPSLGMQFPSVISDRATGPAEPLFWFRKFRILSKFSPAQEDIVREIVFHPGLNIVWSKAADTATDDAKTRTAGHASGKSTLCCLLRGLLGEPYFAAPSFLQSIRETCHDWWCAAELRINGTTWCVARPFCGKGLLAAKADSLDGFLAQPGKPCREEFGAALDAAARIITPIREFPGGTQVAPWSFFPWFMRDQDAQFASISDWTDPSNGGTGAPPLSQIEKSIVMRSVFDPSVSEEVQLLDRMKRLEKQLEQQNKSLNMLRQFLLKDSERLARLFDNEALVGDQGPLQISVVEKQFASELDLFSKSRGETAEEHEAHEAYLQASREYDVRVEDCFAARRSRRMFYAKNREYLARRPTPPKEPSSEDELMAMVRRHPTRRFCGVKMEIARECRCQLALENEAGNPPDEESVHNLEANLHSPSNDWDRFAYYQKLCAVADEAERDLDNATTVLKEAEERWQSIKEAAEKERLGKATELGRKTEALNRFHMDNEDKEKLSRARTADVAEKKDIEKRLAEIRTASEMSMDAFRLYFNETLRFVYGQSALGKVTIEKGLIHLDALVDDTNRKGAALKATNVVCFDLALLALATGGGCSYPGFLVHDGPRVADLSPAIYRRYFEFADFLASRPGTPNFQYIVTTTTNPPEKYQGDDYVVCRLDASTVDGRLLRRNLS